MRAPSSRRQPRRSRQTLAAMVPPRRNNGTFTGGLLRVLAIALTRRSPSRNRTIQSAGFGGCTSTRTGPTVGWGWAATLPTWTARPDVRRAFRGGPGTTYDRMHEACGLNGTGGTQR